MAVQRINRMRPRHLVINCYSNIQKTVTYTKDVFHWRTHYICDTYSIPEKLYFLYIYSHEPNTSIVLSTECGVVLISIWKKGDKVLHRGITRNGRNITSIEVLLEPSRCQRIHVTLVNIFDKLPIQITNRK